MAAPLTSMLKTSLISSGSQPDMVADEVDNKVRGEYSNNRSAGGGGSIEKSAKSKNFKIQSPKTSDARKNLAS